MEKLLTAVVSRKSWEMSVEKKLGTEPGKREILDLNEKALRVGADEVRKLAAARKS